MRASLSAVDVPPANGVAAEVEIVHDAPTLEYAAEPWRRRDVIRFAALTMAGLLLLAAGWFGAGGETALDHQVPFLNLAVGGVLAGTAGGAMLLVSGLRAVRFRKETVKARIAARAASQGGPIGPAVTPDIVVAGDRMTRYHRPECSLVLGKPVAAATREEHERVGRRPCGMCQR